MKKVISANVDEEIAERLDSLSLESTPHLSKSAIVEYAIKTVDLSNFIQEEKIETSTEKRNKKTS